MAYQPGNHEPSIDEVLRAFVAYKQPATIGALAGELQAWNRRQHVASVVGDLVAHGLVGEGRGGWCLTERGEKTARRRGSRLLSGLRGRARSVSLSS